MTWGGLISPSSCRRLRDDGQARYVMLSGEGLLIALVAFVLGGAALVALVVLSVAGARRAKRPKP